MSEMVERVAKAIALAGNGGAWETGYTENQREFHRMRARAAIEAMRALRSERYSALLRHFNLHDDDLHRQAAQRWYEAMIDEALK